MKQFRTILKFELMGYFKNKSFLGVTIFFVVVSAVLLSLPSIFPDFINSTLGLEEENDFTYEEDSDNIVVDGETSSSDNIFIINADFDNNEDFINYLTINLQMLGYSPQFTDFSLEQMETNITQEKAAKAFFFTSPTEFTSVVLDVDMFDFNSSLMTSILQSYVQIVELEKLGATNEQMENIMSPIINEKTVQIGKNQMDSFFYTYILIFLLYISVLLYGQFVAMSVVTEKTSRCMELLVTSAKPTSFIFGKVIGSGIAGLLQLSTILGTVFICYNLNAQAWANIPIIESIFNIPSSLMVYMLIFFICGFFIYAFLFGALASFASKIEDINSLITPIMFLFIASFLVTMISLASGNFENTLLVVCSYIPFTSSMAMFTRIAMDNVPIYEILISIGILIGTTALCGCIAAKIYRVGVLMYGNKPNFKTVISVLKK